MPDTTTYEEADVSNAHIPQSIYRISNLELWWCSQSHYASKSIGTTQHLVSEQKADKKKSEYCATAL